jgi:hypothetical protein
MDSGMRSIPAYRSVYPIRTVAIFPGVVGDGTKGVSATTIPRYAMAATEIPKTTHLICWRSVAPEIRQ